jgi:arylsulfatase A-like enzyme
VSLVDTAPTILDLMGMRAPDRYQGRSMLDSPPQMALFFADYSLGLLGVRDGPWKLIYELESRRARMFDMERDPFEKTDISRANPERAARYTQVVQRWSGAQQSYLAERR